MTIIRYMAVTENQRGFGNPEIDLWEEFKKAVSIDDFDDPSQVHAQIDAAVAAAGHQAPGIRYARLRIEIEEVVYVPPPPAPPVEDIEAELKDEDLQ